MKRSWTVAVVAALGLALPYIARLPGCFTKGAPWLAEYVDPFWLIEGGAAVAATAAAVCVVLLRRRRIWMIPVAAGYAHLALVHGTLELNAPEVLALVFIPLYSLGLFGIGAAIGVVVNMLLDSPSRKRKTPAV